MQRFRLDGVPPIPNGSAQDRATATRQKTERDSISVKSSPKQALPQGAVV